MTDATDLDASSVAVASTPWRPAAVDRVSLAWPMGSNTLWPEIGRFRARMRPCAVAMP